MAEFEIRVNRQPYALWQNAVVERSLGTNCGTFSFDSSSLSPGDYPVRVGDLVQVLVDGVAQVTGYVDAVAVAGDTTEHKVSVSGRDTTQDLVDSSVPDSVKVLQGPLSLLIMAERVVAALGANVPVLDASNGANLNFTQDDLLNADSGKGAMEFLVSFARKKQVYLIPDGQGRLLIFRPDPGDRAVTALENVRGSDDNNVKDFSVEFSAHERFNVYRASSQDQFAIGLLGDYAGEGTNRQGSVTDPGVRAGRFLEVQGEESLFETETRNRAEEEANLRRARSVTYEATVAGAAQEDGSLWRIGQTVKVNDEFAGVRGIMLVTGIRFGVSVMDGTFTRLVCLPNDAYQVRGTAAPGDARKASLGSGFVADPASVPGVRFLRTGGG